MHSMKEKFKYFIKVRNELYDIIEDAIDLDISIIVKMMQKHLASYNSKNIMYKFTLTLESDMCDYKLLMSERQSYKIKPIYNDVVRIKQIIREKKLNSLLG